MKFRLANLLRVRALQEDSAAADAARAAREARAARARVKSRREALASAPSLDTRSGQLAFAAAVAARSASTHLFTESLTLADQADGASMLAQAEFAAARRRLRALERLAERSAQAEAEEALRVEQAELDEHASSRARSGAIEVSRAGEAGAAIDLDDAEAQCLQCHPAATIPSTTTPMEPSR